MKVFLEINILCNFFVPFVQVKCHKRRVKFYLVGFIIYYFPIQNTFETAVEINRYRHLLTWISVIHSRTS